LSGGARGRRARVAIEGAPRTQTGGRNQSEPSARAKAIVRVRVRERAASLAPLPPLMINGRFVGRTSACRRGAGGPPGRSPGGLWTPGEIRRAHINCGRARDKWQRAFGSQPSTVTGRGGGRAGRWPLAEPSEVDCETTTTTTTRTLCECERRACAELHFRPRACVRAVVFRTSPAGGRAGLTRPPGREYKYRAPE
ncbi:Hypothetical predicted protein, partial [Olea europaea subsp. europaea]